MLFSDLHLIEPLLRAVRAEGYTEPSPIQVQAIPPILEGRDLLGCAQTGTGKTAAFALPILQRLTERQSHPLPLSSKHLRVLVLSPTRELASQIGQSFATYGQFTPIRQITIFGGVNQNPQVERLRRGADVLVATPGRLLDLMGQGYVKLDRLEVLVLDEADRMLDMGFIRDVRKIIAQVPAKRQTLLFSATMPADIQSLADNVLRNPVHVAVTPVASTVETIEQSIYFVEKPNKSALLEHLLRDRSMKRVLVFTRTKHGANKLAKQLDKAGMFVEAIHGNKSQSAREQALSNFKNGKIHILVATDIAARGLDVEDITHVVNYDLPNEPESYVHRIGRTGRAGASGKAYSFCDKDERAYLIDIERLIRMRIPAAAEYPYASDLDIPLPTDLNSRGGKKPAPQPRQQNAQTAARSAPPQRAAQPKSDEQPAARTRPNRRRRQQNRRSNSSRQSA